jgi:hypothetical protein
VVLRCPLKTDIIMTQVSAKLMLMMLVQLVVTCNDGYRGWRHEDAVTFMD